jgi:hypothetical protein
MTFLRTLKKLLFGETWLLPAGLALALLVTLAFRDALGDDWHHIGGFVLLAGVLAVVVTSVGRSARAR